jgi:hypothetical protein
MSGLAKAGLVFYLFPTLKGGATGIKFEKKS